jgi:cytoskeleton protein RodZ
VVAKASPRNLIDFALARRKRGLGRAGKSGTGGDMPLDLGGYAEPLPPAHDDGLQAHATLGESLRAARHDRGLTLDELAETTRVRRSYLEAIEEGRLEVLPSRPFTIGYIRAYAGALGLDPEAAVDRFKTEEPVLDEPLRAPVGVPDEKDPRLAAFTAAAMVIVAAIITWNVAQRAMTASAPPPPKAPEELAWKTLAQAKAGPFVLGEPLPAPVESTIPPPYETPGIAAAGPDGKQNNAPPSNLKEVREEPLIDVTTLPAVFTPDGKVYAPASPALASPVTIQAIRNGALIVRGGDGSVYFARQLAKGEAYRVPNVTGLTLDVSDREAFQVFAYGRSTGILPGNQTLASKLITAPPAPVAAAPAAAASTPALSAAPPPAPKLTQ